MGSTTPIHALPYPASGDAFNVPVDVENLANALDALSPVVSATAPAAPVTGTVWYNPSAGRVSIWDGTAWQVISGGPLFIGYQNAVQSIPNTTWTPVTLQGSQVDTDSGWSATTNPSRYTARAAGWYRVNGVVGFGNNTVGTRDACPFVNGSQANTVIWQTTQVAPSVDYVLTEGVVKLLVGDYVEIQGYQSSGGALSTVAFQSSMSVQWIHA